MTSSSEDEGTVIPTWQMSCQPCENMVCPPGTFRTGCNGCQACNTPKPAEALWAANIQGLDCQWICPQGQFKDRAGLTCQVCRPTCAIGRYLSGCGPDTAQGVCRECTNKPEFALYSTSGGLEDACEWECQSTYHRVIKSSTEQTCVVCEACEVGHYRTGCGEEGVEGDGTGIGTCVNCTFLPDNGRFTQDGGFQNACPWTCSFPFYRRSNESNICNACEPEACGVGFYLKDCGESSPGTCASCTGKPPGSVYTSPGGYSDSCGFECLEDFYYQEEDGVCLQCATDCSPGEFRQGCGHQAGEGSCVQCTGLPEEAFWTGDGGLRDECSWACEHGFWSNGFFCARCAECGIGEWRQNCGGTASGQCTPCDNVVANAHYVSDGGVSSAGCDWDCDAFFFLNEAGLCEGCRADCPAGTYLQGCDHNSRGACVACLNIPAHATPVYDTDGTSIDTGECPYECRPGFHGDECDLCDAKSLCNSAGECHVSSTDEQVCLCFVGFSGDSCEVCDVDTQCLGHADSCGILSPGGPVQCLVNGVPGCDAGWQGQRCDQCDARVLCSGQGTCINPGGTCSCDRGFTGSRCERCRSGYYPSTGLSMCTTYCTPQDTCHNHVTECTSQGQCGSCNMGWSGTDCGTALTVALPEAHLCPMYAPLLVAVWYPAKVCSGDCQSCTTLEGWQGISSPAPTCQYLDNRYYRLFQGSRCWDGPSTCKGSQGTGVQCKAYDVVQGDRCPGGKTPLTWYWERRTCTGDCRSCSTGEGFATTAPSCTYEDDKYYLFLLGTDCWNGPQICIANVVRAVACPP